jgi:hypothetical protein
MKYDVLRMTHMLADVIITADLNANVNVGFFLEKFNRVDW